MKIYEKPAVYVKKLPWTCNVKRLQEELQPIKPLMFPWDRNVAPWLPVAKAMSFLHVEGCPENEKLERAIYSWTPSRMEYNDKDLKLGQYNFSSRNILNGTLVSDKLSEDRSVINTDNMVFNEDYKDTEFYNVFKQMSKYYTIDKFRIINLPACTTAPWHTDNYENLHIPIETNIGCRFVIDNLSYHLPADGSIYTSENCPFHSIFNSGTTDRYNILISVTGYKEGSYKLCNHYDRPGLKSNVNDPSYVAKPIESVNESELWKKEEYGYRK
jgi:hypothetical protein